MAILISNKEGKPIIASGRVGRNAPCPCGSGKKAKNCCGTEPKYYYNSSKPKQDDNPQH